MTRTRPFRVYAFFDPARSNDGGGSCTPAGTYGSLRTATAEAERRLRLGCYDRVQIRARIPGQRVHPWWFYLDGDDRVCLWQKHPSQPYDAWGFCS